MKVVVTKQLQEERKQELQNKFPEVTFIYYNTVQEAKGELKGVAALFSFSAVTEELLKEADELKWLMVSSAGVDRLPMDLLEKREVVVTNASGVHAIQMGEYALHAMLDHARNAKQTVQYQKQKEWKDAEAEEIHGKTVVLLGTGAISKAIARRAKVFGMIVNGVNSDGRAVEGFDHVVPLALNEEVLREADYVINVLPATDKTNNIADERFFHLMKETAAFINIGRGNAVNEEHLLQALKGQTIDHAYLDVFKEEPLSSHSPFWELDNVTITPHIAGNSSNYLERLMPIFIHNLHVFVSGKGQLKNRVNIREGY